MKIQFTILLLLVAGALNSQATPAAPITDETALTITDEGTPTPPGANGEATQALTGDVGVWDFVRMIFILAVVVGLVYAFIYFMKKAGKIGNPTLEGVQILGSQILTGNRVLYVVDVAGEVLLLGAGDASITLIKEITDPEVKDALRRQSSKVQETASTGFSQFLQKFMKTTLKTPLSADSEKTSVDFLKKQRERLKKM